MEFGKGVNQGNTVNNGFAAADTACGETETQPVTRRPIKLTQKALIDKLETMQKTRKSKLTKASNLKGTIQELNDTKLCAMKQGKHMNLCYNF